MEKTYKRVPFDIELAKKIQAGEVEGRIVTEDGGWGGKAFEYIELPEEAPQKQYDEKGWEIGKTRVQQMIEWEEERQKKNPKFKPFDKVLVREDESDVWKCRLFDRFFQDKGGLGYCCQDGISYDFCIPYEGNEHLVGTTNNLE